MAKKEDLEILKTAIDDLTTIIEQCKQKNDGSRLLLETLVSLKCYFHQKHFELVTTAKKEQRKQRKTKPAAEKKHAPLTGVEAKQ